MGSWTQKRWQAQWQAQGQGRRTDLQPKISLPQLACLMKVHPDSDKDDPLLRYNGHHPEAWR